MKIKQLLLYTFFTIGFVNSAYASHIIGGEITYTYVGEDPNQAGNHLYDLTMIVYRDCFNGQALFDSAPGAPTVAHLSLYEGVTEIETIILDAPDVIELDPNGDVSCFNLAPSNICVEQGTYTFQISIPFSTQSYYIVYQRCCRSAAVSNLEESDLNGITISTEISPQSQELQNSSPSFLNTPPIIACVGTPFSYSLQCADVDGDSLVYNFCDPLKGGSMFDVAPNPDLPPPYIAFEFVAPSTSDNPFGLSGPTTLDATTGLMQATPEIQGLYVAAVCVDEYRDGVLLSSTQRNILINFYNCTVPVISLDITAYPDSINTTPAEGMLEVVPTGGTPPYTFLWDDPGQQTTPSISGLIPGEYSVTVTDANGCEVVATGVVDAVDPTTSSDDINFIFDCSLYPNPSSDVFNLSWSSRFDSGMKVHCYNLLGEKIYTAVVSPSIGTYEHAVDLSNQPRGIYFITLETNNGQLVKTWRAIKE